MRVTRGAPARNPKGSRVPTKFIAPLFRLGESRSNRGKASAFSYPRSLFVVGVVLGLVAAACGSDGSDSTDSATSTTAEPDDAADSTTSEAEETEPDEDEDAADSKDDSKDDEEQEAEDLEKLAEDDIELIDTLGDYQVGVSSFMLAELDGGERQLTLEVWFPLKPDVGEGLPAHQYTFLPGTYYESPNSVTATADQIATDGPFPLVIYSHGAGGTRYAHSNYTENIASHGYVVVALDHPGDTSVERLLGTRADGEILVVERPQDVSAVIDAFIDTNRPDTVDFAAAIDPEQIAVTGHSFGGFTSFAVVTGYANELGGVKADDRVKGIITLAPAAGESLLDDDQLASVDVPMLIMVGSDDKTTPVEPNVTRPWDLTTGSPSYRVDLEAAEHQTFTDVCDYVRFLSTLDNPAELVVDAIDEFAAEGCSPGDMPIERAQAITNTFAVRFLEELFRDGEPITPEEVDGQTDLTYLIRP